VPAQSWSNPKHRYFAKLLGYLRGVWGQARGVWVWVGVGGRGQSLRFTLYLRIFDYPLLLEAGTPPTVMLFYQMS